MVPRAPIARLLALTVLLALLLGRAHTAAAQWTSIGPSGRDVRALALDPQTPATLWAGTEGSGLFKSTAGGASRSSVNIGLTKTHLKALAFPPGVLCAGRAVGRTPATYTDDPLTRTVTRIKGSHIIELRAAVRGSEERLVRLPTA